MRWERTTSNENEPFSGEKDVQEKEKVKAAKQGKRE